MADKEDRDFLLYNKIKRMYRVISVPFYLSVKKLFYLVICFKMKHGVMFQI